MASYSASSWSFGLREQGPIEICRDYRKIVVKLNRKTIIKLDMFTGVANLECSGTPPGPQLANAYNRFFEITDANRYSASLRGDKIILNDSIKNVRREITGVGLNLVLPTRSVVSIIAAYPGCWSGMSEWKSDYEKDRKEARQSTSATVEIHQESPF